MQDEIPNDFNGIYYQECNFFMFDGSEDKF